MTETAKPLTPAQRLTALEDKVHAIGTAFHSYLTNVGGHRVDNFIAEFEKIFGVTKNEPAPVETPDSASSSDPAPKDGEQDA